MRLTYDPPLSTAHISACGTYRYRLGRTWDPGEPGVCFVMLNPSTADAAIDDPTIRRCIAFAKRLDAGWLLVANLFALRSTDPSTLFTHPDPVGPENDEHIIDAVTAADLVICAWGAHPMARARAAQVRSLLHPHPLHALGLTKGGDPRHPLYLRGDASLVPWPAASRGSSRGSEATPPTPAPESATISTAGERARTVDIQLGKPTADVGTHKNAAVMRREGRTIGDEK